MKYSVITVCLNEKGSIGLTCKSILSQSFKDYEWIVIDGGSTDGTVSILNGYSDRMSVFVSEPDSGIYNAMNKGISLAQGDYVIFMNGGDRFATDQVLEVASQSPQTDLIYGDLVFDGVVPMEKRYPDLLPDGYLLKNTLPHQSSFFKRDLFDKYGVHNESFRIAGDYDLFVRFVVVHNVSTFHVPVKLAIFSEDGISKKPDFRALRKRENHIVRKKYFPDYRFSLRYFKEEFRSRMFFKKLNLLYFFKIVLFVGENGDLR